MKKILFLSPLPPPYYGSAMSSEMCLEIIRKSKEFEVINIKLNCSREIKDIGRLNMAKIKGFFYVKKQIKNEIKAFQPDIVYFMPALSRIGLIRDYLFIKEIRKHFKKTILIHVRERIQNKDWLKFKRIYSKMFENCKVIILDRALKEDLHNLVNEKNIFILSNAIKDEVSEKRILKIIKNRNKKNTIGILFLSNMDKTKGWPKVLGACKILKEKGLNFKCNFVGEWPSKKEEKLFEEMVLELKLGNNVKYLGKKIGRDKEKIFENSHALVFPTEYPPETFGRVNIEAMMYALPVVANGIAAIPSIINHGATGFVLGKNSSEEIAFYLEKLIKNSKVREKMGRLGRKKFLQEFEIKKYGKKFLKVIRES